MTTDTESAESVESTASTESTESTESTQTVENTANAQDAAGAPPEPTTAGRRERNKAAKRERILAAATEAFAERGYEKATMAQVAAGADVAIGTVFQYAATKPELLMMVTAQRWTPTLEEVRAGARTGVASADPVARILALLDPLVRASADDPETTAAIARELLFGAPGPHRDAVLRLVAALEEFVAEVLHDAGAHSGRAAAAARLIVSGALLEINRTRTGRAGGQGERTVDARLATLVAIAVAGSVG